MFQDIFFPFFSIVNKSSIIAWDGSNLKIVKDMQVEIMENGPIVAGMQIFEDFLFFDGGIYRVSFLCRFL